MRRRKVGRNLSNTLLWVMASLKVVAVLVYLWELSVEFTKKNDAMGMQIRGACKFGGRGDSRGRLERERERERARMKETEGKRERKRDSRIK